VTPAVLVAAGSDIPKSKNSILSLIKHTNITKFYLIFPEKDRKQAEILKKDLGEFNVELITENNIYEGLNICKIKKILKNSLPSWPENHLAGWYFQQFLKMSFSLSEYCVYEKYLIWDADTILLRPIVFEEGEKILFRQGNEYHKFYFKTMSRWLEPARHQSVSHISQHMLINSRHMRELIGVIEMSGRVEWWAHIIETLSGENPFEFSEYETYSNYCLSQHGDKYISRKSNWFRFGHAYLGTGMPANKMVKLSKIYDFVAIEKWDTGLIRKIRSHTLVNWHYIIYAISKLISKKIKTSTNIY